MRKARILAVDDEKDILRGLKELLESEGLEVRCLENGKEVIDTVKNYSPDLILLDVMLGDSSGYDIKERLNRDITTSSIPVIFLTVNNTLRQKRRGLKAGAADYIVKPFDPAELIVRIEAILTRRKFYENMFMRDPLTGLYNRPHFEKQSRILHTLSRRYSRPFSMAVIDIKGLRDINESLGFEAGSYVLKRVGQIIDSATRSMDMAARFSGDEFIVLLPETESPQAAEFIKRIRSKIEKETYSYNGEVLKPRVSAGSATCLSGELELEDMFSMVDMNIHVGKIRGRKARNGSVLIIEDEGDIANGIKLNLESEGFSVRHILYEFDEAVEYIKKNESKPPDFVILDLDLGGILSPDLLGLLYSKWKETKVFIFTGHPEHLEHYPYFRDIVSGAFTKKQLQELIKTLKLNVKRG